jgi:arylsulfatase A-like enzyme
MRLPFSIQPISHMLFFSVPGKRSFFSARVVPILLGGLGIVWLGAAETPKKPVNLLFIMTDQQRWDAMSVAGNSILKTPHLDQLASEGARFSKFYSSCPVCVPARTVILTGHSLDSSRVRNNNDVDTKEFPADFLSFDQILLRNGYRGEYYGKWHAPYQMTLDYTRPVRWLNGKAKPAGSKADLSDSDAYKQYVMAQARPGPLQPGQLTQKGGAWVYTPIPLDINYGKEMPTKSSQAESYGRLDLPAEYSSTAYTAREGLEALERLKHEGAPFTLTISLDPPHPPMMVSEPYYSRYPAEKIPVPVSIADPLTNSPYASRIRSPYDALFRDPQNIRQMTSIYYGMVAEVDDWVGKILKKLDDLGLTENTLVIFTSDHGEELGDHGLYGKFVFYEGSVHVPLLMRLPGVIPAQTVVAAPAAHIDLFPTILDYLNQPAHPTEGFSLRSLIEGQESAPNRVVVSEWDSDQSPGLMVTDGRWKYLCGRSANAPSLDALYDLQIDPEELNNLIGRNPDRHKYHEETARMKGLLLDWMAKVKSPRLAGVQARPLFPESKLVTKSKL